MRSTMMDIPLTITSIMRYGTSVFGDREVVTCTDDGTRRRTYAEAGRRAARLAARAAGGNAGAARATGMAATGRGGGEGRFQRLRGVDGGESGGSVRYNRFWGFRRRCRRWPGASGRCRC